MIINSHLPKIATTLFLVLGIATACTPVSKQKSSVTGQPFSTLSTPSGMIQMERGLMTTFDVVSFQSGKAELTAMAQNRLNEVADFIHRVPYRVAIEGHTDNTGETSYNQWLSEQRALAVHNALVTRGVDPNRLITIGYGESRPIASNQTHLGRQQNRRWELIPHRSCGARQYATQA